MDNTEQCGNVPILPIQYAGQNNIMYNDLFILFINAFTLKSELCFLFSSATFFQF